MTPDETSQVIALLVQQTYVREVTPNDSPEIREYLKVTGNEAPAFWCLAFLMWGIHYVLGDRFTLPYTAGCQLLRDAAKKRGMIIGVARRGCIGLVIDPATDHAHHAFMVTGDPDQSGRYETIEGNSNDNGSRNGDGVYEHRRGGPGDTLRYEFVAPEGM